MRVLKEPPIFRVFHLGVAQENAQAFQQLGQKTQLNSLKSEENTLSMSFTTIPNQLEDTYVIELYENDKAHQHHITQEPFLNFKTYGYPLITTREVVELESIYLYHSQRILSELNSEDDVYLLSMSLDDEKATEVLNKLRNINTFDVLY